MEVLLHQEAHYKEQEFGHDGDLFHESLGDKKKKQDDEKVMKMILKVEEDLLVFEGDSHNDDDKSIGHEKLYKEDDDQPLENNSCL